VTVQSDGTLLYTPFDGFRGTDTIRYTVADDLGARSLSATITIDTNLPPIASDDLVTTFRGVAIDINVAANDSDPDGTLNLNSVLVVTRPVRGTTIVLPGGFVRYVPDSDFVGIDTFQYTIKDNLGRPSNVALVRVQVVGSELQNPSIRTDVDASGETSPLDALLILNRLARANQQGITGPLPIELLLGEDPLRYYDVDGSRFVEPLDALLVINEIARQNRTTLGGEGESGFAWGTGSIEALRNEPEPRQTTVLAPTPEDFGKADLLADFGSTDNDFDDLLGLLAADRDADEERSDESQRAFDAAWEMLAN